MNDRSRPITATTPWNRSVALADVCQSLDEMTAEVRYQDEEITAIQDYVWGYDGKRSIGKALNAELRRASETDEPPSPSRKDRRRLVDVAAHLDSAMERWELPLPTEVHRGLRGLAAFGGPDDARVALDEVRGLVGSLKVNYQMLSCTVDEVVARDHFARHHGKEPPVLARIEAGDGVDAIWVDVVARYHRYEAQREIIFGPYTLIEILDADIDRDGMVRLTCQMTQ